MHKLTIQDFPRKKFTKTIQTGIGSFLDGKSIQESIDYLRDLDDEFSQRALSENGYLSFQEESIGHDGGYQLDLVLKYPESDTDYERRYQSEVSRQAKSEQKERLQLAQLKAKYEKEKS